MNKRKRFSKWLKKRAAKASIGISMLDIISNALAGTMCLFFALSAIQAVPPEAPRIIGKLIVAVRLEPISPGVSPPALFMKAPKDQTFWFPTFYESDMLRINFDYDTIADYQTDNFLPFNVYRNPNDSLQYEFHFTNPRQGKYEFGAIYTDHARFSCDAQPVKFHFQAHLHKTDTDQTFSTGDSTVVLKYPTETCSFIIYPPIEAPAN